MAAGEGVTRHPGADAAEQLSVTGGEPQRNEELSSLAAVFRLPEGNLLIRQARLHEPPFPHIRLPFRGGPERSRARSGEANP